MNVITIILQLIMSSLVNINSNLEEQHELPCLTSTVFFYGCAMFLFSTNVVNVLHLK